MAEGKSEYEIKRAVWDDREQHQQNIQFKKVLAFKDIVESKSKYSKVPLNNGPNSLYEKIYKLKSKRYISRPHFMNCMSSAYGFDFAQISSIELRLLNALYTSFDVYSRDELDWRYFLLLLYIALQPGKTCKDFLSWGYCLFSSEFIFESQPINTLPFSKIKDMIGLLVVKKFQRQVFDMMDDALIKNEVSNSKMEKEQIFSKVQQGEMCLDNSLISIKRFQQIIENPPLSKVFEVNTLRSEKILLQRFCKLCPFEEFFCTQSISTHVGIERRQVDASSFADTFVRKFKLSLVFKAIRSYHHHRTAVRRLFCSSLIDVHRRRLMQVLVRIRTHALSVVAVTNIQRIVRGYLCMKETCLLYIKHMSAIRIQSFMRSMIEMKKTARVVSLRIWASIEVQRVYRGCLGRYRATIALMSYIQEEKEKLDLQIRTWRQHRRVVASTRIQSMFRVVFAKNRADFLRIRRERTQQVAKVQNLVLSTYIRERKVIEAQLSNQYEQAKSQYIAKRKVDEKVNRDRVTKRAFIRSLSKDREYQRVMQRNIFQKESERKNNDKWVKDWAQNRKERIAYFCDFCLKCLREPNDKEEQKLRKRLYKLINSRYVMILVQIN